MNSRTPTRQDPLDAPQKPVEQSPAPVASVRHAIDQARQPPPNDKALFQRKKMQMVRILIVLALTSQSLVFHV